MSTTVLVRACRELLHVHHKSVQLNSPWLCTRKAFKPRRSSLDRHHRQAPRCHRQLHLQYHPSLPYMTNNYQTSTSLSECTLRPSGKGNEPTFSYFLFLMYLFWGVVVSFLFLQRQWTGHLLKRNKELCCLQLYF